MPAGIKRASLALAIVVLPGIVGAQAKPDVPPQVSFVRRITSAERWPQALAAVDRDAFVTVLAITPGVNRFAVQVLAPDAPDEKGFIRARHPAEVGYFVADAIGHRVARVSTGTSPIVIGISSTQRPDLSAFARGKAWAHDVVVNVPMDSTTDLVDVVAAMLFKGEPVAYGVSVMPNHALPAVASFRGKGSDLADDARQGASNKPRSTDAGCGAGPASTRSVNCGQFDDSPGAFRWSRIAPPGDRRGPGSGGADVPTVKKN